MAKCCYRLSLDRRDAKRRVRQKIGPKETDSAEEGTLVRDGLTLDRNRLFYQTFYLEKSKKLPPPDKAGLLHAGNSPHLLPSL